MTPIRGDDLPLGALIRWRAHVTPEAPFARDEHGRSLTFHSYLQECEAVAADLQTRSVGTDSRVAWMLPTSLNACVVSGALALLDAVQIPLIPILREREVEFILRQTQASVIFVPRVFRGFDYAAMATAVASRLDHRVEVIVVDGDLPKAPARASLGVRVETTDWPLRWIFYTSGTTSNPKGTLHTDYTVGSTAHRCNVRFAAVPADVNGLVFPITHIGGISWLMGGLMVGYSHILIESFNDTSVEVLYDATILGSGPAFWMAYVAHQRRNPDRIVFPHLRALLGGGAAKSPQIHEDVNEVLGVVLATGYGSTEVPALAHSGVYDDEETRRCDGYALDDVEIRIVRDDETVAALGEEGEIRARGPMLFHGYLDPADDADALDEDGYWRSGDLGRLDERGRLRVTGRAKDIIIRKGENISAKEVEDLLMAHPSIADVAVFALADPERGELACAAIVIEHGRAVTLDDVGRYLGERGLARHKHPERLEVVTDLPRNPTGKVIKSELKTRFGPG